MAGDIPVRLDGRQSYSVLGDSSHSSTVAAVAAAATGTDRSLS